MMTVDELIVQRDIFQNKIDTILYSTDTLSKRQLDQVSRMSHIVSIYDQYIEKLSVLS